MDDNTTIFINFYLTECVFYMWTTHLVKAENLDIDSFLKCNYILTPNIRFITIIEYKNNILYIS